MQSSSGRRHVFFASLPSAELLTGAVEMMADEADAQSGICLLYAILRAQPVPSPVLADTEVHVVIKRSIVPSRSGNEYTDKKM